MNELLQTLLDWIALHPHAFNAAVHADPKLYDYAFDRNIVIVTPSTLLATLKTVETMWRNEKQNRYAIEIANDTPYGLSGGVISNHWPSIQRVITELDTGTVNVNEAPSYRLEWTPFGGVKDSGLGYKEGVIETMKGYTYVKTYSLPWDIA